MPNLVGIGLSQVPTNSMLGGLAYQDPEHASIKNLDLKNLSQINSEIADTAVDVFVYDTRKDSDGGAWRKRTQHTSWYNETLGTATRGTRKEFPAVAVIVATIDDVIIYDGDDPDLPMWMIFESGSSGNAWENYYLGRGTGISFNPDVTGVAMLNATLVVGKDGAGAGNFVESYTEIDFISDNALHRDAGSAQLMNNSIVSRNGDAGGYYNVTSTFGVIVHQDINDVAMTVLPNAPIDSATGLPTPTIAVATDGGTSVIKDDGTVVDIIDSNSGYKKNLQVKFTTDNKVVYTETSTASEYGWMYIHEIPSSDETITINTKDTALGWYDTRTQSYMQNILGVTIDASINVDRNAGLNIGVGTSIPNIVTGNNHIFVAPALNSGITLIEENRSATNSGLVAYATTSYNTGWMHGDCKGAFLSDTDDTNLSGYLYDDDMQNDDTSDWSDTYADTFAYITSPLTAYQLTRSTGDARTRRNLNGSISGGTKIIVTYEAYASSGTPTIKYGMTNGSYDQSALTAVSINTNWNLISFEATFGTTGSANHTYVTLWNTTPGATVYYRNFKVRVVEEDRSVNNKSLAYFGTITKSAVATGAELVAYSGFSASNYLEQPYNSTMEFGTGDFYMMAWIKTTDSTNNQKIIARDLNGTNRLQFYTAGTKFSIYTQDAGSNSYLNSTSDFAIGEWICAIVGRKSSTLQMYVNGKFESGTGSNTNVVRDVSFGAGTTVEIGRSNTATTNYWRGSIALARIGSGFPSPEQIKKMYEDEKCLFQENAKATLYGSSDAVTALAFDDTTNLLHVGTSAGRSEFQGLRRINNTTDAVTTAISASNGLVAEQ